MKLKSILDENNINYDQTAVDPQTGKITWQVDYQNFQDTFESMQTVTDKLRLLSDEYSEDMKLKQFKDTLEKIEKNYRQYVKQAYREDLVTKRR